MSLPFAGRVPGDADPGDLFDLVRDCHELPEALAARLPVPPGQRRPATAAGLPVIHSDAVAAVQGWSAYGS
ncbi:MAG: hypothetical protein JWL64_2337 [Frankiales bacterium]|nr:hypothetical protein [Frankiales bacterium]